MLTRLLFSGVVLALVIFTTSHGNGAKPADKKAVMKGDAAKGQGLFNDKGICHYCHGTDGFRNRLPVLSADTKAVIDRFTPSAADLRKPEGLRLKDDQARFHAIREGHPGSGMFPDRTLTEQDINDLLAYLSILRRNAPVPGQTPY